ncbi:MAG: elongation factor Ts [Candidatus Methylumidiphilus alinenensis]|uniref:Elongation factor Ts n=1 Tax=Candidatus Methylumidiphilus alinenensis TaxID=2202197 RepID=A0A2W4QZQ3_9GAMM|nr:MAG: elongation factor Ts [Candidatus Methylumidiphilus alinenensis]
MNISAALVKDLRERTGSGMMECKKALVEAGGDIEAAVEIMRKSGLAKADKKSSRTAAEGRISVKTSADSKIAVVLEINCETDFVAKNDDFIAFADAVAESLLVSDAVTLDDALALSLVDGNGSIEERRRELIAKLGENINVRRFERYESSNGLIASYLHGTRIGVLVEIIGGDIALGRDIAMHVAASKPVCVDESGVSAELIAKEKDIYSAQAAESGKPADIIEKMVGGRIKKFFGEITLLGQPFVKDPDQTVGALLKAKGASVLCFSRLEVGEGIEKEVSDFAEEVMSQAGLR